MSVAVVDVFEVIQVGHDHAQGFADANAALGLPMQQAQDRSAVPEACQVVMRRLELQFVLDSEQRALQFQNALAGSHPRPQFIYVEWLGQVVVSAAFQSRDHILLAPFGSEQQYIFVGTIFVTADSPAQLDTVQARHHPIQNCHLRRISLLKHAPGIESILQRGDTVVPLLEPVLQDPAENGIILRN